MARAGGVTTANIMPGSGNAIGGQTLYVKLRPGPIANMMVQPGTPEGWLKMANGEIPKATYAGKAPGTRMATAALIRNALVAASNDRKKRASAKADSPADRNLKHEALGLILDRKIPALFAAHRADDLVTALRLTDEFGLEARLSMATEAYLIHHARDTRRAGRPSGLRPGGRGETGSGARQREWIGDE
jgi:hypothetical protein